MDYLRTASVITLPERHPQNFPDFVKRNAATGIDFQMVAGVDGAKAGRAAARAAGVIEAEDLDWTDGAIGNAWSHRNIWQKTVTRGTPSLVFEDDAYVRRDLVPTLSAALQGLPRWDLIVLGFNTNAAITLELFIGCQATIACATAHPTTAQLEVFAARPEPITLRRLAAAFGTCGYLISPQAAAALLTRCFPLRHHETRASGVGDYLGKTLDVIMVSYYPQMWAFTPLPPLVMVTNDQSTSTTLKRE